MQFIKNGPDIPERLLQAHEDGRVVFFCGAGISFPARLPGFRGLVEKLYVGLGESPSSIEQAAIKKEQYDTAIGLLEGRMGRATLREQLAKILMPVLTKPKATATHEALVTLSRTRDGNHRLITTNFDRIFEEVISKHGIKLRSYQAPLLPVPKNRWSGLVYLHGLLSATPTDSDLDCLVVSSGDFGLAYLNERWAARFVSELFRNYTVCFVGYSINDPVLRYMMDALAADRLLGESPPEVFAFGSYSKEQEHEAANEWQAKNVTAILYRAHSRHAYLHQTLREWAATYHDGVLGKERIVVQYAMTKPVASTKQDDFVGRVLWALSDHSGLPAKRFAEFDPLPSLDWLEPLADKRYQHRDLPRFKVQPNTIEDDKLEFSLILRPTPYTRAPWMTLAHGVHAATSNFDAIMLELARWLARHLDNPKLILWVAKNGGVLHSQFAWFIAEALEDHPPSTPMQKLWHLVLTGRVQNHMTRLDFLDWHKSFKREGLTPTLRLQLRDLLTPRVRLSEPFHLGDGEELGAETEPSRVKDLVNWEIVLCTDYVHYMLKDVAREANWNEALTELISDASMLLRDALDLMRELDGADDRHDGSYSYQPSISEHPQNRDYRDWTALIEFVRDAWIVTAVSFPERARLEVERWRSIPYPLFKRLTFFAATNTTLFTPQQAFSWLLADDYWWLWSTEVEREAIRLLVTIAPLLDVHDRDKLERAILQGPPLRMFRDDIEPERLQRAFDREIWLRLAKANAAGTALGSDASTKLHNLSQQYPMWRLATDERDEFPIWMGDGEDWRTFISTPKRYRDIITWLREHPKSDTWQEDDWRDRCKRDFRRAACALLRLASQGEWLPDRWREALQAWSDETLTVRSWRHIGSVLAEAPDEILTELSHALGWWLQSIAKTFNGNEDAFFTLIRRVIELHRNEAIAVDNDLMFKAINHPIGHVTKASLSWWYRQSLEDNQGLTDVLKPIFTGLCDTGVSIFRYGRILLASHVISLFRVDGDWSRKYLLPLFEWQRDAHEAKGVWEGFLYSPRLYKPLMDSIKLQFLTTAQHYAELGKLGEQYAALLTFAALDRGDTFTISELSVATHLLPADGLERTAQALVNALEGAGAQRAEYWRNRVLPYIKSIWPKSRDLITPAISQNLARLCAAAQEAFPEALRELRRWLQPLDHPDFVVHLLHEANLCAKFPEESLAFLDAVIGDHTQWIPRDLKVCLDLIRDARPALEADYRFRRLGEYLRRHGRL